RSRRWSTIVLDRCDCRPRTREKLRSHPRQYSSFGAMTDVYLASVAAICSGLLAKARIGLDKAIEFRFPASISKLLPDLLHLVAGLFDQIQSELVDGLR